MTKRRGIFLSLFSAVLGVTLGYASTRLAKSSTQALHTNTNANVATPGEADETTGATGKSAKAGEDEFTHLVSALREGETLKGRVDLYRALSDVRVAEIPGLMKRAQQLPLKLRKELVAALFEHWVQVDRSVAEAWIREEARAYGCYAAWARASPQEALNHCLNSPWMSAFWSVVPVALDGLAGKDPRAQLEILAKFPASSRRSAIISNNFESWAQSDPKSALEWAANLPDDKLRSDLEKRGVTGLAKVDPGAAASRMQTMIPDLPTGMVGNGFVSEFTRGLAEKDLTIAREFVEGLPAEFQFYPMVAVGTAWAKTDPIAALDWAQANGIDVAQMFRTEMGLSSLTILGEAMSSQTKQTIDWLQSLPEGNQRDAWLQNALFQNRVSVKKDAETMRQIFDGMSPDRQQRLASGFGKELAATGALPDLQTWASWIPDESVRARAIGGAIAGTFDSAPARAEAMLADLPAGPIRDQALAALTQTQTFSTPSAAAGRALNIQDQTLRYDTLDRFMNAWMNRDRQTAEAWLDAQTDLPREWVSEWRAIKPTP